MDHTTASTVLTALAGICAAISAGLKLYGGLRPPDKRRAHAAKQAREDDRCSP